MFFFRMRVLLSRGLRLRCPVCGEGKLYRRWFRMYTECPACHFVYEREPGYFTGGMAINLTITCLLIVFSSIPLSIIALNLDIPLLQVLIWGLVLAFLFPLLFYHHSNGIWMSLEHLMHPVSNERIFFPDDDPSLPD